MTDADTPPPPYTDHGLDVLHAIHPIRRPDAHVVEDVVARLDRPLDGVENFVPEAMPESSRRISIADLAAEDLVGSLANSRS